MKRRALRVDTPGRRLAEFLAGALPLPAAEAEALVRAGAVYVGGKRSTQPDAPLSQGAAVVAVLEEGGRSALEAKRSDLPLQILLEDEALIAVAKPAGITAQPTASREGESLLDQVSGHLGRPAGLVHRLDRETSGVTVFGKTAEATSALAAEFREGSAKKRYLAVCGPQVPDAGSIDLPISKDPSRPGRYRASATANGIPALTHYRTLFRAEDHALVVLFPQTGRTHQLRAHLTALHAPIAGDERYGGARTVAGDSVARCLLHAHALSLKHPTTGEPLLIEASVPEDLARFFQRSGTPLPTGNI